jgi:hypothetical protein
MIRTHFVIAVKRAILILGAAAAILIFTTASTLAQQPNRASSYDNRAAVFDPYGAGYGYRPQVNERIHRNYYADQRPGQYPNKGISSLAARPKGSR